MVVTQVDLAADVGESFGVYTYGEDEALMPFLSSANVACGFHAGDPMVMRQAVKRAAQHGVVIGAHPGYPDLVGFGRRAMVLTAEELEASLHYQVGALGALAAAEGLTLRHVKPHGAMYNQAEQDERQARALAHAMARLKPSLLLVGLAGSAMERAAREAGIAFAREAFADRAYAPDGSLSPRSRPGAVHTDPERAAAQVQSMVRDGQVTATDGRRVAVTFDILCLHGDTPGAAAIARRVRQELETLGVAVRPFS
jgi:UPF0271 protein